MVRTKLVHTVTTVRTKFPKSQSYNFNNCLILFLYKRYVQSPDVSSRIYNFVTWVYHLWLLIAYFILLFNMNEPVTVIPRFFWLGWAPAACLLFSVCFSVMPSVSALHFLKCPAQSYLLSGAFEDFPIQNYLLILLCSIWYYSCIFMSSSSALGTVYIVIKIIDAGLES